jgi:hypothetical protein
MARKRSSKTHVCINNNFYTAIATQHDSFVEVRYINKKVCFFVAQIRILSKELAAAFVQKFTPPVAREIFYDQEQIIN